MDTEEYLRNLKDEGINDIKDFAKKHEITLAEAISFHQVFEQHLINNSLEVLRDTSHERFEIMVAYLREVEVQLTYIAQNLSRL